VKTHARTFFLSQQKSLSTPNPKLFVVKAQQTHNNNNNNKEEQVHILFSNVLLLTTNSLFQ
jgi:hypothetical protein